MNFCFSDASGNPHHLCLAVYYIPRGFSPTASPHGNAKSKIPYHPTWPSTRELIKQECNVHGPKRVVQSVSSKVGGVMCVKTPGTLPRNEQQALYYRRTEKRTSQDDDLFHVVQLCKSGGYARYIRDIRAAPEPSIILATDRQILDLVKFCTQNPFCVMTVDPTFNLGEFDVTVVTYRQMLLESSRYSKHPVFVGPIMIHYRKTHQTYLNFISTLIGLQPELANIKAFGTDGEEALYTAFSNALNSSTHLICSIHLRRNIKQKLKELGCSTSITEKFIGDIMGSQIGSTYYEGLIDCADDKDFDQKFHSLKSIWESRHENGLKFYNWFDTYKAALVKSSALSSVRTKAGLGSPPSSFNTNVSETVNFMLKSKVDYKKSDIPEFINKMHDLITDQQEELQRAICGRGKWQFCKEFKFLEVSPTDWFCMTPDSRKRYFENRVQGTCLSDADIHNEESNVQENQPSPALPSTSNSLSVNVQSFSSSTSVPLQTLTGIWLKAEALLADRNNFSLSPGCIHKQEWSKVIVVVDHI